MLTDVLVRKLKPREKRYVKLEGNGFGIRVGVSGKKTWVMAYRIDGRLRWHRIGEYPKMSLADARIEHGQCRELIAHGRDPAIEKPGPRSGAVTFGRLGELYLSLYAKPRKRSWEQDEEVLKRDLIPVLGSRRLVDITRREVIELLDRIVARGAPSQAARTLALVRRMFSWAVEREIVGTSPVVRIPRPTKKVSRERVLSNGELLALWDSFTSPLSRVYPGIDRITLALQLILLTGQRPGEVREMTAHELDAGARIWTIPGARTKSGSAHVVPISGPALAVIEAARLGSPEPWVFGRQTKKRQGPYTRLSIARTMRRHVARAKIERATPHDLRRTCASGLASLGTPRVIVARILGHADPTVTAIYDRYAYVEEMRAALEAWGREVVK